MNKVRDIFGEEIEVGDTASYDNGMKHGKVTKTYPEHNSVDIVTGHHFGEVIDSFNIQNHGIEKIKTQMD